MRCLSVDRKSGSVVARKARQNRGGSEVIDGTEAGAAAALSNQWCKVWRVAERGGFEPPIGY